tara:strand:+ start:623 stop:808 length:186 start_codon:yes stop_codon:yes gene_type:complete
MLVDMLLQLNPAARAEVHEDHVAIDIPSLDPDPHAEWAQQLEEQEQYEAQDPDAGDSDGGE